MSEISRTAETLKLAKGALKRSPAGAIGAISFSALGNVQQILEKSEKLGVTIERLQRFLLAAQAARVGQDDALGALDALLRRSKDFPRPNPAFWRKAGEHGLDLGNTKDVIEAFKRVSDVSKTISDADELAAYRRAMLGEDFEEAGVKLFPLGSQGIGNLEAEAGQSGFVRSRSKMEELAHNKKVMDRFVDDAANKIGDVIHDNVPMPMIDAVWYGKNFGNYFAAEILPRVVEILNQHKQARGLGGVNDVDEAIAELNKLEISLAREREHLARRQAEQERARLRNPDAERGRDMSALSTNRIRLLTEKIRRLRELINNPPPGFPDFKQRFEPSRPNPLDVLFGTIFGTRLSSRGRTMPIPQNGLGNPLGVSGTLTVPTFNPDAPNVEISTRLQALQLTHNQIAAIESQTNAQNTLDQLIAGQSIPVVHALSEAYFDLANAAATAHVQMVLASQAAASTSMGGGGGSGGGGGGGTEWEDVAIQVALAVFGGGFARGGRPPVGIPSLVGERGPELFVPDRAGTIVPNHKLGGMGDTYVIDARGADKAGLARLENMIVQLHGSIERRAVAATTNARARNPRQFGAARA